MDGTHCDARAWAEETFSGLEADARLARRLVHIGHGVALRPAGQVTQVFSTSAEREATFRFLENKRIRARDVGAACFDATARSCAGQAIYVAFDGTTLSLTDRKKGRQLGGVGSWAQGGRGLHVHTALAVDRNGVTLGVCGQEWWARECPTVRKKRHRALETETRFGVRLLKETHDRLRATGCEPWFQLDRGFDGWPILQLAYREQIRLTVRAVGTRKVLDESGDRRLLREILHDAPVLHRYTVKVPAASGRAARVAHMEVRAATVVVPLSVGKKRREFVPMQVVQATEIGPIKKPLEWILLTTVAVRDCDDARAVLHAYTMRWRVEEFHRTWKRGHCNVEDSQLRSRAALIKWATIHATVAARANRLTQLRDAPPTTPATDEFSRVELDALILLREPKGVKLGYTPSLVTAIRWIADVGGYTGKSSGGPPGATVIARGLAQLEVLARGLANFEKMRSG